MMHSWLYWIWIHIIEKLWPMFIVVVITQKFIEMRKPKLEMLSEGRLPGSWKTFDVNTGNLQFESPYHMWRIKVRQIRIPKYLAWLIRNKEAALQCRADLIFYTSYGHIVFSMQGRWVNSPEISFISKADQQERILYPDTIAISYNSTELLDCIVKFDGDKNVAYAWNNEAYAHDGRNPRTKLGIGTYKVDVRVSGQNFQPCTKRFDLMLSGDWQEILLTH